MMKYYKELSKLIGKTSGDRAVALYKIVGSTTDDGKTMWRPIGSSYTPRSMDSIFIEKNKKTRITNHLDKWVQSERIYKERGLNFKTGILLYGTPGTGKSSMAIAIASYLNCPIINIDTSSFQYIDIATLVESINEDDDRYVILIDEIDTIFSKRSDEKATKQDKENTAKLLSLLDSPNSPTNVVFVATTNYLENLDEALLRKGRFDLTEEFNRIDKTLAMEMCESFGLTKEETIKVLKDPKFDGKDEINPSDLQDSLIFFKKGVDANDTDETIE